MITGEPVTVRRYDTDRYGDRTLVSEHVVQQAAFAPRTSASGRDTAELTDRAATVTADAELYVPHGADILPQDVIWLDGIEWEVVGLPERWRSPYTGGWLAGAVIPLRRKTG